MDKLQKLHKANLYLLVSFDKVCREKGLTYFLDSGSALGAVRHGGFIPWDDDVDVGMPRKDYERFLEIGQQALPNDIFLQTRQTEKNYERNAAKLRLNGTFFPEEHGEKYLHNGIFIDIFPFDNVPNSILLAKLNIKYIRSLYHIVRSYRRESLSPQLLNRLFHGIIKAMPESLIERIERHYLNYCRHYENKETGKMTCHFWRMTLYKDYIFDSLKMLPTKDIEFEGKIVRIMKNPDYYLRLMYGNYMKLPPLEKRITHCSRDIDFGVYNKL